MKYLLSVSVMSLLFLFGSFKGKNIVRTKEILTGSIHFPVEIHFANVRQLAFGGDNAEAYFSKDGKYLIFQKADPKNDIMCDQIWMRKVPIKISEKFEPKLISTG